MQNKTKNVGIIGGATAQSRRGPDRDWLPREL